MSTAAIVQCRIVTLYTRGCLECTLPSSSTTRTYHARLGVGTYIPSRPHRQPDALLFSRFPSNVLVKLLEVWGAREVIPFRLSVNNMQT